jgi:hypothetical protein
MAERYAPRREWSSPVHAPMTKKRHKFGVDGRILLVPIIFPCLFAVPFGHDFAHQVEFAALAGVLWLIAKALWEWNPYFLDDFMAEFRMPQTLADDASSEPLRQRPQ